MSVTEKFLYLKRTIGGIRSDTPPSTADGDSIALRVNQYGEAIVAGGVGMVPAAGSKFSLRAAAVVTTSFIPSSSFATGNSDLLLLFIDKTGTNNPTYVDFDVQLTDDGGTTWRTHDAIMSVSGGFDIRQATYVRKSDIGASNPENHLLRIELTPQSTYQVGIRYSGGTAPTIALSGILVQR